MYVDPAALSAHTLYNAAFMTGLVSGGLLVFGIDFGGVLVRAAGDTLRSRLARRAGGVCELCENEGWYFTDTGDGGEVAHPCTECFALASYSKQE